MCDTLSVKRRDRGSKQAIDFSAEPFFFSSKKMNQINTKNYWK